MAAENGHVNVLEWAESKYLDLSYSVIVSFSAAGGGQVAVLDWLNEREMVPTTDNVCIVSCLRLCCYQRPFTSAGLAFEERL